MMLVGDRFRCMGDTVCSWHASAIMHGGRELLQLNSLTRLSDAVSKSQVPVLVFIGYSSGAGVKVMPSRIRRLRPLYFVLMKFCLRRQ